VHHGARNRREPKGITVNTAPPRPPFDQTTALSELHTLGRTLDRQVTERTGTTAPELDATLRQMSQLHGGIMLSLNASLTAAAARSSRTRADLTA
jgi:hypothetical protein